ncbi:MAG: hypothetical protein AAF732_21370 [Pseudomonadota bacterium]
MNAAQTWRSRLSTVWIGVILSSVVLTQLFIVSRTADAYPRIVRIYCKRDYKRLCPRYRVGSSRMRQCMRAKARYLSPVCQKAMIDSGLARRYGY